MSSQLLLICDNALLIQGITSILNRSDFHSIEIAKTMERGWKLLLAKPPDLVLVYLGQHSQILCQKIKKEMPHILVILEEAERGNYADAYFNPNQPQQLLGILNELAAQKQTQVSIKSLPLFYQRTRHCQLSRRERQVLLLMSYGHQNRSICQHLEIGIGTVKTHVSNILNKLCAHDRTHAVVIGLRGGLIE